MKYIKNIISVVLMVYVSCCVYAAQDSADAVSVFSGDVPKYITDAISGNITDISARYILEDSERQNAIANIESMDLVYGDNKVQVESIKKMGLSAIPVINEMLLDKDKSIRRKAMVGLSFLFSRSRWSDTEYMQNLELVAVMLGRRSQYDVDYDVRQMAITLLRVFGVINRCDVPKEIVTGLDLAMQDSDSKIRLMARSYKVSLGLLPREPTDWWY